MEEERRKIIAKHGVTFYVTESGVVYNENGRLLNQTTDKLGYKRVARRDYENKPHTFLVHRLVAQAFLGDIEGKQVHHVDRNPSNNHVSNLQIKDQHEHDKEHKWKYPEKAKCVICGNDFYPYETKRKDPKVCSKECWLKYMKQVAGARARPVNQYDKNGNFIKKWDMIREAAIEIGGFESNITKCCRGDIKSYKGYKWEYANDD